ncbi:MAG: O-succinylhomoserine sulfhydrylase [Rhodospirillales bacterium]|jgi:O-succinylhomoserine sulfhydrylase|nr:O-succinylhomoserine sulfhydrylase [Rhodospirillales bacterium]
MDAPTESLSKWRLATRLVRGGTLRSNFAETSEGLFMTSGYVYESAEQAEAAFKGEADVYIYSRYSNPTVTMLQERLALLEGAEFCRATASGMAAVFASLASQLDAGDRIVSSRALFGSCHYVVTELLPRFGIECELVDGTDLDAWRQALGRKRTQCVFLETPSNPTLEIIDLNAVAELTHAAGAKLVVDNVFATPILQQPLEFGADIVVYSTTKHMDGQGRSLGGAILTNDEAFITDKLTPFMRHTGPSASPFNAWIVLKGLETLEARLSRHCANALTIAEHLSRHQRIARVLYPTLASHPQSTLAMAQMSDGGTVLSFEFDGGRDRAFRFLNALSLIDISNNLGDSKSLVTHPATTTHSRLTPEERTEMGIGDGLVRLSVGLEDAQDVIEDLDQALEAAWR